MRIIIRTVALSQDRWPRVPKTYWNCSSCIKSKFSKSFCYSWSGSFELGMDS
jgi:hypothetical protein